MFNSRKITRNMISNGKLIKKLLLVVVVIVLTTYSFIDMWNNAQITEKLEVKSRALIDYYGLNDVSYSLVKSSMDSEDTEAELDMVKKNNIIVKPEIFELQPESQENCEKFKLENYLNVVQKSTKEKAFEFIPHLKNPCWYEEYGEKELNEISENPFKYTVYSPKYIKKYKDNITKIYNIYQKRLNASDNRRLRCIPYFYIIGQPKCGTTDLYKKLSFHPQIKRGLIKETHWWRWSSTGIRDFAFVYDVEFSHFTDLFSLASVEIENKTNNRCSSDLKSRCFQPIICDGSAFAMDSIYETVTHSVRRGYDLKVPLTVPEYIRWTTPNVKLIVLFRNPVDRLFSGYNYFAKMRKDKSQTDFHNQVESAIEMFTSCITANETMETCFVEQRSESSKEITLHQGMYSHYLEEWLKVYPKNQILVLRMEDYKDNMRETLNRIYKFLGVCNLSKEEEDRVIESKVHNKGKHTIDSMLNKTKQMLEDFYRPFNKRLAQIMNDDKFLWF